MLTVLLIGALVALLVILGRESDGPQVPKVVEIVDSDEDDLSMSRDLSRSRFSHR